MHGVVLCEVSLAGTRYLARLDQPRRLHIPLCFDMAADAARGDDPRHADAPCAQPNHFGAPRARATVLASGSFHGDTRRGGSCNAVTLHLTPHCNGTHTEGVGHLTRAREDIDALLSDTLVPAAIISIRPVPAAGTRERARHALEADDQTVTAAALDEALAGVPPVPGLIVRTWPNDPDKRARRYEGPSPAPFFTLEAARFARERGVRHLLVDLPSLDRAHDEGHLGAHRAFWGMAEGDDAPAPDRRDCTITEMIYVDDGTADGLYLLNLQIAPLRSDASPSRVIVYPLEVA